jgi:hypothetical protein
MLARKALLRKRFRKPVTTQIQASQERASGRPMLRQVSQTTPSGVSHMGQESSGRSRCRSIICAPGKP